MIQWFPDEKFSSIIERYRIKSGSYNTKINFVFNSKNLSPSLFVAEVEITNNPNIFVISFISIIFMKVGGTLQERAPVLIHYNIDEKVSSIIKKNW